MKRPLSDLIRAAAIKLPSITDHTFGSYFDSFGDCKVILLGDCSHGTSEFYSARAEITKRLIEHHGFNIIACEADWPDAEAVDRYIRQRPGLQARIRPQEAPFKRFPTWMWRNKETQALVEWLRDRNAKLPYERRAGFYGLDLYSLGASLRAVIEYLDRVDPKKADVARRRYGCLEPWVDEPSEYGLANLRGELADCEGKVIRMLQDLLTKRLDYSAVKGDGEEFHSAEQNARLVADAEAYYKSMYYSDRTSWNLRDTHMFETLKRLLDFKPKNSKAVVWAHNSHVGDARFTSMGWSRGEINIGQLCRQEFGKAAAILGCGTHTGTVAAAHNWDDDLRIMPVNPSRTDSYERLAHDAGINRFILDLREGSCDGELREALMQKRLERFIGVIYRPATERYSHYSHAVLPEQFDAYVWFDETKAVQPLEVLQPKTALGANETYPFGL